MASQSSILRRLLTRKHLWPLMCHTDTLMHVYTLALEGTNLKITKRQVQGPSFPSPLQWVWVPLHKQWADVWVAYVTPVRYFVTAERKIVNIGERRDCSGIMAAPLWAQRADSLCFSLPFLLDGPPVKAERDLCYCSLWEGTSQMCSRAPAHRHTCASHSVSSLPSRSGFFFCTPQSQQNESSVSPVSLCSVSPVSLLRVLLILEPAW